MQLTKSKKIEIEVFWCDECEEWLMEENTFVCLDCGERFCDTHSSCYPYGNEKFKCRKCFTKNGTIAEKINKAREISHKTWLNFNKVFMEKK